MSGALSVGGGVGGGAGSLNATSILLPLPSVGAANAEMKVASNTCL